MKKRWYLNTRWRSIFHYWIKKNWFKKIILFEIYTFWLYTSVYGTPNNISVMFFSIITSELYDNKWNFWTKFFFVMIFVVSMLFGCYRDNRVLPFRLYNQWKWIQKKISTTLVGMSSICNTLAYDDNIVTRRNCTLFWIMMMMIIIIISTTFWSSEALQTIWVV